MALTRDASSSPKSRYSATRRKYYYALVQSIDSIPSKNREYTYCLFAAVIPDRWSRNIRTTTYCASRTIIMIYLHTGRALQKTTSARSKTDCYFCVDACTFSYPNWPHAHLTSLPRVSLTVTVTP